MKVELRLVSKGSVSLGRVRGRENVKSLPVYDVFLDGEPIGRVYRRVVERERRTPGRRYVNARWRSVGWFYDRPDERHGRLEQPTRAEAVAALIAAARGEIGGWKYRDEAKTAKVIK